MRWASRPISWLAGLALYSSGIITALAGLPLWKEAVMQLTQEKYAAHVQGCDQAMREHFLAKMKVVHDSNRETVRSLEATEIGLFACQDYDIFQKQLMQWGLSETELSRMRLEAIEAGATSLREVVAEHEFRY